LGKFRKSFGGDLWENVGERNLSNHKKPQNNFRKSKFPDISYTFTGKLDFTDVHLPDM
jgi:hypothetical protein